MNKLKLIEALAVLLIPLVCIPAYGQYVANATKGEPFANLDVNISDDINFEDLSVEIGENASFPDFTVGFTPSRRSADVIISNSKFKDFKVNISEGIADLKIKLSNDVSFADIKIKIKTSFPDYLVYNETHFLSPKELVCILLPIINLHLDNDDKLKNVPIYKARHSLYDTFGNHSKFVEPVITSKIDGEFRGWEGDTVFKLRNGQMWKQAEYDYMYTYDYMPEVEIYETTDGYMMKVEDVEETIKVKRIN